MVGETSLGTYGAYSAICLLLLVFVVMFVRLAIMLSLLFLSPAAQVGRRLTGFGRRKTSVEEAPESNDEVSPEAK
jgi:hypothetical protein